jgi:hypothetical protein
VRQRTGLVVNVSTLFHNRSYLTFCFCIFKKSVWRKDWIFKVLEQEASL